MGTCYSKSGDIDPSMSENRPKEKKGSSRNGHLKAKNKPLLIVDQIQKDVSDTVYTEDSHTVNALDIENCINKSQQTSLDHLAKELNKNSEVIENSDTSTLKAGCNSVVSAKHRNSDNRTSGADFDSSDEDEKPVVIEATDSGIVVENKANLGSEHRQDKLDNEDVANDMYSESFEMSVDNEQRSKTHSKTESQDKDNVTEKPFQPVKKIQSPRISSLRQSGEIKCANGHHSNISCNGESRQSISSLDRLSESHKSLDSTTTDLDKIKLVLRQASVSSTEQRYSIDPTDTSYELPCLNHQPEITTMTMNGREVVVIDAELFTQITDEIQFLKMKLSQLTEVIQESEAMEMSPRHSRSTPLSSVSSVS